MSMKQREDYTAAALYARVSSDRQDVGPVDRSTAQGIARLRREERLPRGSRVHRRGRERTHCRQAPVPKDARRRRQTQRAIPGILVWKFSRFTRKREHAVAFKSMLRRRGIRVTSITEHADDSPTGKLMEAIIESVDEFYSENLAQGGLPGGCERPRRVASGWAPTPHSGYRKVYVQDGVKTRPKLEPDPPADAVVKRIFDMALQGKSSLDITKALNAEGVASPKGKQWLKSTVHTTLNNEAYNRRRRLGCHRQGRRSPGTRGESTPRPRLEAQVPAGRRASALPRSEDRTSPSGVQPLPAQRSRQVRDVRQGPHSGRGQEW